MNRDPKPHQLASVGRVTFDEIEQFLGDYGGAQIAEYNCHLHLVLEQKSDEYISCSYVGD